MPFVAPEDRIRMNKMGMEWDRYYIIVYKKIAFFQGVILTVQSSVKAVLAAWSHDWLRRQDNVSDACTRNQNRHFPRSRLDVVVRGLKFPHSCRDVRFQNDLATWGWIPGAFLQRLQGRLQP